MYKSNQRTNTISHIGKIKSTHGLDGAVIIRHPFTAEGVVQGLKHVFIELQPGSHIPFFIRKSSVLNRQESLITFEDINNVDQALEIINKDVFVEAAIFKQLGLREEIGPEIVGFLLKDENRKVSSTIEQIYETPGNIVAAISVQGKEVLVPLSEEIVLGINRKKKEILVELPEGLLEVYL